MSGEIKDECGVVGGALLSESITPLLYKMLLNVQNRGQLSAGITTYSAKRNELLRTFKEIGTVNEVFQTRDKEISKKIMSRM